jgi:hypothetical protein
VSAPSGGPPAGAPVPPESLWDDDPAERRRRLDARLEHYRAREAEEADWVTYLPADRWFVDVAVQRAAEWAAAVAARELKLSFTPTVRWFREGGPLDRETDHPEGFRDRPGVGGYVREDDPHTVWLSTVYCQAGDVSPSLQETVAHECEHVRQVMAGWRGRDPAKERLATLVARQLVRGESVAR